MVVGNIDDSSGNMVVFPPTIMESTRANTTVRSSNTTTTETNTATTTVTDTTIATTTTPTTTTTETKTTTITTTTKVRTRPFRPLPPGTDQSKNVFLVAAGDIYSSISTRVSETINKEIVKPIKDRWSLFINMIKLWRLW